MTVMELLKQVSTDLIVSDEIVYDGHSGKLVGDRLVHLFTYDTDIIRKYLDAVFSTPASISRVVFKRDAFDGDYRIHADRVIYFIDKSRTVADISITHNKMINIEDLFIQGDDRTRTRLTSSGLYAKNLIVDCENTLYLGENIGFEVLRFCHMGVATVYDECDAVRNFELRSVKDAHAVLINFRINISPDQSNILLSSNGDVEYRKCVFTVGLQHDKVVMRQNISDSEIFITTSGSLHLSKYGVFEDVVIRTIYRDINVRVVTENEITGMRFRGISRLILIDTASLTSTHAFTYCSFSVGSLSCSHAFLRNCNIDADTLSNAFILDMGMVGDGMEMQNVLVLPKASAVIFSPTALNVLVLNTAISEAIHRYPNLELNGKFDLNRFNRTINNFNNVCLLGVLLNSHPPLDRSDVVEAICE